MSPIKAKAMGFLPSLKARTSPRITVTRTCALVTAHYNRLTRQKSTFVQMFTLMLKSLPIRFSPISTPFFFAITPFTFPHSALSVVIFCASQKSPAEPYHAVSLLPVVILERKCLTAYARRGRFPMWRTTAFGLRHNRETASLRFITS